VNPAKPRAGPVRRPGLLFAAAGAGGVVLSASIARREILLTRWGILGLLVVWLPLWAIGATAAQHLSRRRAIIAISFAAVALRLAAIGHAPPLSDDLHRYAWDAKVQAAGVNPYEYAPDSPALTGLRDRWLWPDGPTCRSLEREPGCTRINRPAERTIYPPVAQVWFVAVRTVSLGVTGPGPWQAAAAAADLALCGLLAVGLRRTGRDPRLAAWWALSPVAVVEIVANAHVDGLAALLVVGAVLAARRRPGLAGALIGAAAMVKLYPAVLLIAVARRNPVRAVAAFGAVCVAVLLPHIAAAGPKILGYLPGYLREEHYDGGGRFLLVGLTGLPGPVVAFVAVSLVLVMLALLWWADLGIERTAPLALSAVLLVATPVQPWYGVTVAALGLLAARPGFAVLTVAAWPYFFSVILNDQNAGLYGRLAYGFALLVVVATVVADSGQWRGRRDGTIRTWRHPTTRLATGPSPPAIPASTAASAPRS